MTNTVVQILDDALIQQLLFRARSSPRLRTNHNLHESDASAVHRFLNVFIRGTYVAPHRHVTIPKHETFIALRGQLACFIFDDAGHVLTVTPLGCSGIIAVDIPAGAWHTIAPITEEAVCFEVKPGPWDAATDKEFAPWAPQEGDPAAARYLQELLALL